MSDGEVYRLTVESAEAALAALSGGDVSAVASRKLLEWIREHRGEAHAKIESSWTTYLPAAAKDPSNRIGRQPSGYGYILVARPAGQEAAPLDELGEPEDEEESESSRGRNQREARLYPILRDWLEGAGYRAGDTSATKRGGAWGNPDITGIAISEGYLGSRELEVATIEAKVSLGNWKREFFEAVAHKRFAHRAYFAFAVGTDEPSLDSLEVAPELRAYGEKYRVGIVVIFLPASVFEQLAWGETLPDLVSDDLRVEELWPALFDQPNTRAVSVFLHDVLRIADDDALYSFGRT